MAIASLPPLSAFDLAPVVEGGTAADALNNARVLARHVEATGYRRFWMAEHHNLAGIASAATAVALAHVADGTRTIRVGSGGIMLPNHAPLIIAEQFGTLEALFPGRIDLGLGRAPGTDQKTLRALRRDPSAAEAFPQDVMELQALLGPAQPGQAIHAIPGEGTNVPIWILGSSLFGADLAAALGLPYAFAAHFAPGHLMQALGHYRDRFRPSEAWPKPHAMVAINVVLGETDEEARHLFTSIEQKVVDMVRGRRSELRPPVADMDAIWSPMERRQAESMLACSFVGAPQSAAPMLEAFARETGADELMVSTTVFDFEARLKSYSLLAELAGLEPAD